MKHYILPAAIALIATGALADNQVATLRGPAGLADTNSSPLIAKTVNSDLRQARNYPEQPPVIPHKIDGYQIDLNANKCMTCHSRKAVEESQAPMISITHFMSRDGQFLATASPRRYFCTQCHVPATEAKSPVANTFVDVDDVLDYVREKGGN